MSIANEYEPDPVKNLTTPLWECVSSNYTKDNRHFPYWREVYQDFKERDEFGKLKYGVSLQAFNGRNPKADLRQEVLDSIVYSYQCYIECEDPIKKSNYKTTHQTLITMYENLVLIEKE